MGEIINAGLCRLGKSQSAIEVKVPRRILVADDDHDILRLNTKALSYSGYEVEAVEDGALAWDTLQQNNHDLLITDNQMPRVTGIELLRKLHAAHMAVPVILATGIDPKEEFVRYPWLKPSATLLKPYTIDQLLGIVQSVLSVIVAASVRISPAKTYRGRLDV